MRWLVYRRFQKLLRGVKRTTISSKTAALRARASLLLGWGTCIFLLSSNVQGLESHSFNTLNLNPMVQIFGLPSLTNQTLSSQNTIEVEIEQQAGNYHSQSSLANEQVRLDGETWRTNLTIAYGLSDNATLSLSTPYVRHSPGYMDRLIYNFHETFGMPQGERTKSSNNNIDLQYSVNGRNQVKIDSSVSGIGDIRIKYAHKLPVYQRYMVLQGEIKLPTGDITKLTGSGGTDLSIGFMVNDSQTLNAHQVTLWTGAAATYLGSSDSTLSELQNDMALSIQAGLGWHLTHSLALKAQLDTHSAVYDSNTIELGKAPLMLTIGGDYYFSPNYRLEFAAVEDLVPEASPDIIFSAKFSAKFE